MKVEITEIEIKFTKTFKVFSMGDGVANVCLYFSFFFSYQSFLRKILLLHLKSSFFLNIHRGF